MSTNAGNLLWNRKRIALGNGVTSIDTGLRQTNLSFGASSDNEPVLAIAGASAPGAGALPASRVQVIPLAGVAGGASWDGIGVSGEPYLKPATGTVWVDFIGTDLEGTVHLNVLFWDPHTSVGPGQADTYNPIDD